MKRIVSTWPYVAGVAVLAIGWLLVASLARGNADLDGLPGLYVGTVAPLAVAVGGVLLGIRRTYDWVVVVASLATWVILAALFSLSGRVSIPLDAAAAATLAYLAIGHVGVVAVLAINRLGGSGPSKED